MSYTSKRQTARFGWRPDLPDHRDFMFSAPAEVLQALPQKVDLRDQFPAVYDQMHIGSCTANAIAGAIQFDRLKAGETPDFVPSRLFIYYFERDTEGHVPFDSGAQIRDGIKVVASMGVCPEPEWPYDATPAATEGGPFPTDSRAVQPPPGSAIADALNYKVISYQRVLQNLNQMKGCLAAGFPFVIGFTVYESFVSPQVWSTGVVPLPSDGERVLGGHAVLAVGYDDASNRFFIRNSWGNSWGVDGYGEMPYAYLTDENNSSDFWTIRGVAA